MKILIDLTTNTISADDRIFHVYETPEGIVQLKNLLSSEESSSLAGKQLLCIAESMMVCQKAQEVLSSSHINKNGFDIIYDEDVLDDLDEVFYE